MNKFIHVRQWYMRSIAALTEPKNKSDWSDYTRQCRTIFQSAMSMARNIRDEQRLKYSDQELADYIQRG